MTKSLLVKKLNPFLILVGIFSILIAGALAQQMPPNAGRYSCFTTNPVYNVITNSFDIQIVPAFFGDLILDGKGRYTLTGRKTSGEYMFNKTTGVLSFTGDLKVMKVERYTSSHFILVYQSLSYECGLQNTTSTTTSATSSNQASPAKKLNEGLTGKLVITSSYQYNSFLGKVFEFDLATGTYNGLFSSGVAGRAANGEMIYFDKTSRLKITDKTGLKTILQITNAIQYNFDDFYPALSATGAYVALTVPYRTKTGTLSDLVADGKQLLILDRTGKTVAEIRGYQQAAWTPDGRIVAVGDGSFKRGLFIIDKSFSEAKQVIEDFETALFPAVSPDGKNIVFYDDIDKTYVVGIDGKNLKPAVLGASMGFSTWSPDGKFLATNVLVREVTDNSYVFLVNLATDTGFWAKDQAGNRVTSRNRISWSK